MYGQLYFFRVELAFNLLVGIRPRRTLAIFLLSARLFIAQEKSAVSRLPATRWPLPARSRTIFRQNSTARDLAKAMKLVADWQLSRLPADAQIDWTWAALYAGFMAVPDKVAGDKYKARDDQDCRKAQLAARPARDARRRSGRRPDVPRAILDAQRPEDARPPCARASTPKSPRPTPPTQRTPALVVVRRALHGPARLCRHGRHHRRQEISRLHGSRVGHHHRPALRPLKASLLPRRRLISTSTRKTASRSSGRAATAGSWAASCACSKSCPPIRRCARSIIALLKEMAAEMLSIQGKDGLWRPGLLDADAYPLPEISGSAFITYALPTA